MFTCRVYRENVQNIQFAATAHSIIWVKSESRKWYLNKHKMLKMALFSFAFEEIQCTSRQRHLISPEILISMAGQKPLKTLFRHVSVIILSTHTFVFLVNNLIYVQCSYVTHVKWHCHQCIITKLMNISDRIWSHCVTTIKQSDQLRFKC